MDSSYSLNGCLIFGDTNYPISVPVYTKRNSNRVFVPKTDPNFLILDFYYLEEGSYPIWSTSSGVRELRKTDIGQFAAIPIIENDEVSLIHPTWSEAEIRERVPKVSNEALKMLFSLKSRIAKAPLPSWELAEQFEWDELLETPVSSRYWVSKFRAKVDSARLQDRLTPEIKERSLSIVNRWISNFSAKAPLENLEKIMQVPGLELHPDKQKEILFERLVHLLQAKGIQIPKKELQRYSEIFPHGVVSSVKYRYGGDYDFWTKRGEIQSALLESVFRRFEKEENAALDPHSWSIGELQKWKLYFETIYGVEERNDLLIRPFLDLLDSCIGYLSDISRNTQTIFRLLNGGRVSRFEFEIVMRAIGMRDDLGILLNEDRALALKRISDLHEKLSLLTGITKPQVSPDDAAFAYKEISYHGLDELLEMYQETRDR